MGKFENSDKAIYICQRLEKLEGHDNSEQNG